MRFHTLGAGMFTRALLMAAVAAFAAGPASAQTTYTWDGGGGTGKWSSAANWLGDTLPVSGPTTRILLSGNVQTVTNQDLASPFVLNQLNLGQVLAPTSGFTVNGGAIQFAGTSPSINTDVDVDLNVGGTTAAAGYFLRLNSPVQFLASTAINIPVNNTSGAEVIFGGALSAAAGTTLTLNGTSAVVIASSNNSGLGNLTVTTGSGASALLLTGANALSRQTTVNLLSVSTLVVGSDGVNGGAEFPAAGVSQQIGRVSGSTIVSFGVATSTATLMVGFDNGTYSHSGTFGGATSGPGSQYAKVGTGTLTYTGGNTNYGSGLSVRDGTFLLSNGGRFASAATTVGGTGVQAGARLVLLNSGSAAANQSDRIQDNGVVTLSGGTLVGVNSADGSNLSELAGPLRLLSGESTIEVSQGAVGGAISGSRAARFQFAGLTQVNPTATWFLRSTKLGATDVTGTGDVGGVTFTAAPTALLVGGNAPGTPGVSILPFVTGAATANALDPTGFVTYVGTDTSGNSRTRLLDNATEYASAFGTATDNVSLAASTTVSTPTVANSLRLGADITTSSSLTLTSGALLLSGSGNITGTGPVQFGTGGSGLAYINTAGFTLNLSAPATAAQFAKSGRGTLNVNAPVSLGASPTVAVNAGTLAVVNNGGSTTGGFTPASGGVTYQVARGAVLDVAGAATGLAVGTGSVLQGSGTVTGTTVVGPGGTVRPSGLAGSTAPGTSPGDLTANGAVRFLGGGTYRWNVSSVFGGPYTQGGITGTGDLDLTDPSLTPANRFVIRPVSLTLQNAPGAVYDYDPNQSYTWTLGTFAGGINGFSADKFSVDASEFTPTLSPGAFSVAQVGNSLVLNLAPVPEPALVLGVAAAGLAAVGRLRRRAVRG